MSKIDSLLQEWAQSAADNLHESGLNGINAVEKILRDPGFATSGSRDRVLAWHRSRNLALMSRLMHRIDSISQICLIVRYGNVLQGDGTIMTLRDVERSSSLTMVRIRAMISEARHKLKIMVDKEENPCNMRGEARSIRAPRISEKPA